MSQMRTRPSVELDARFDVFAGSNAIAVTFTFPQSIALVSPPIPDIRICRPGVQEHQAMREPGPSNATQKQGEGILSSVASFTALLIHDRHRIALPPSLRPKRPTARS